MATIPIRAFYMKRCRIDVWTPDYIETVFEDGKICRAHFVDDDETRQRAMDLGYGNRLWQMHLEHEICHTLLAELDGIDVSPVLYHVAGGPQIDAEDRAIEEYRVIEMQRAINRLRNLVHEYRLATAR